MTSLIIREQGASVMRFNTGATLWLGSTQVLFGTNTPAGTIATPGAIYFRTEGSASNMYINTSNGVSGSVWRATCTASI